MVAEFGCVITESSQIHVHHPVGRTYVEDCYQIGELFAYGLWKPLHMNSPYDLNIPKGELPEFNVTDNRKAFVKTYGDETFLFKGMVDKMIDQGLEIPFDQLFLDKIAKVDR